MNGSDAIVQTRCRSSRASQARARALRQHGTRGPSQDAHDALGRDQGSSGPALAVMVPLPAASIALPPSLDAKPTARMEVFRFEPMPVRFAIDHVMHEIGSAGGVANHRRVSEQPGSRAIGLNQTSAPAFDVIGRSERVRGSIGVRQLSWSARPRKLSTPGRVSAMPHPNPAKGLP